MAQFFKGLGLTFVPLFVALDPVQMLTCDFQYAEQI